MGLIADSDLAARIYIYPFSICELNRSTNAEEHVRRYYFEFDTLVEQGLDALIITGANVIAPTLDREPIWKPLIKVSDWAEDNVASILCSCLASHALIKHKYGIDRQPLPQKQWGVYSHEVQRSEHPLLRGVKAHFDTPHSRWNAITSLQLEQAGLSVLAESEEVGIHMAVSPDLFRIVYTQGHPEYDANSLLKEYKREVFRYQNGELESPPPYPENYLSEQAVEITGRFLDQWEKAASTDDVLPKFPEKEIAQSVVNSWKDAGESIFNNWLGLVHDLSSLDRHKQFAPRVDPDDPLTLRDSASV